MKMSPERTLAGLREQFIERWKALFGRQPSPAVVDEVQEALQRAVSDVRPTAGFRQQLGERLSMAAESRVVGVSVQSAPNRERRMLLALATAIALGVTGLALLMRRLAR
jgi:hypothetical protein